MKPIQTKSGCLVQWNWVRYLYIRARYSNEVFNELEQRGVIQPNVLQLKPVLTLFGSITEYRLRFSMDVQCG